MSLETRRVATSEVWTGWESQVVNGVFPLRQFLGGSGHSAVFLTEFKADKLYRAAIKLVPADSVAKEAQLVQWGLAATLSNAHLLRLFDVGRTHIGGREFLFVVMEYAEQTLAQLLPKRALTLDEVREMLLPAIDALSYLHQNNLVHGQLKPSNILVVDDQLKLASDTVRAIGHPAGSAFRSSPYDPPELPEAGLTVEGDVWGLGMTTVESLTQRTPAWPEERPEAAALPPSVSAPFAELLRRALSRDPAGRPGLAEIRAQCRPQSQAAAGPAPVTAAAVSAVLQEIPHGASAASRSSGTTSSGSSRFWGPAVAAAIVISLAVWVSSRSSHSPPAANSNAVANNDATTADSASNGHVGSAAGAPVASAASAPVASVADAPATSNAAPPTGSSEASDDSQAASEAPRGGDAGMIDRSQPATAPAPAPAAPAMSAQAQPAARPPATSVANTHSTPAATPPPAAAPERLAAATPTAMSSSSSSPTNAEGTGSGSVVHKVTPEVQRNIRDKIRGHINVTVRVLVDREGNVVGQFLERPGPSRYFARLAGDAAEEWKFSPVDAQGARVWRLQFEFTRSSTTIDAEAK